MRSQFLIILVVLFTSCSPVRYYIVRHAEKETVASGSNMNATDPPLSAAGKIRAIELSEELKAENIRHIYSTNYIRTINTAKPLQELRGIGTINMYDPRQHDSLITILKGITKGNVLVVGHSNTVDDIVNKLVGAGTVAGDLKDSEYDNIYIVTKKGNTYTFAQKTYGTPTD